MIQGNHDLKQANYGQSMLKAQRFTSILVHSCPIHPKRVLGLMTL